jgi:uncharacterized protein YpuA (DUF1002 family)
MKIRTDFVTNSSSSSFIIARKGELTEAQKDAIIKFVEKNFLGEKILSPQSSNEKIKEAIEEIYLMDENESNVRDKLSNGFDIYSGNVDFEEAEYSLASIYQELWEILAKSENENFVEIETSLEY